MSLHSSVLFSDTEQQRQVVPEEKKNFENKRKRKVNDQEFEIERGSYGVGSKRRKATILLKGFLSEE